MLSCKMGKYVCTFKQGCCHFVCAPIDSEKNNAVGLSRSRCCGSPDRVQVEAAKRDCEDQLWIMVSFFLPVARLIAVVKGFADTRRILEEASDTSI